MYQEHNIYRIQQNTTSGSVYIIANSLAEAINIYKVQHRLKVEPLIIEWIADYYYSNKTN
jgi:virulence-associated protein VapD